MSLFQGMLQVQLHTSNFGFESFLKKDQKLGSIFKYPCLFIKVLAMMLKWSRSIAKWWNMTFLTDLMSLDLLYWTMAKNVIYNREIPYVYGLIRMHSSFECHSNLFPSVKRPKNFKVRSSFTFELHLSGQLHTHFLVRSFNNVPPKKCIYILNCTPRF